MICKLHNNNKVNCFYELNWTPASPTLATYITSWLAEDIWYLKLMCHIIYNRHWRILPIGIVHMVVWLLKLDVSHHFLRQAGLSLSEHIHLYPKFFCTSSYLFDCNLYSKWAKLELLVISLTSLYSTWKCSAVWDSRDQRLGQIKQRSRKARKAKCWNCVVSVKSCIRA